MLDGQLLLTGTEFTVARAARPSRSMLWVGVLCLVLAGCASRTTRAPVVDLNTTPTPAAPAASGATYVVKPGDTLYGISRANSVDIESLKRWNNIADSNHLVVGQVLKLSAPASGAATAPAGGGKTQSATPVRPPDAKTTEPTPLPPPPGEQATTPPPTTPAPETTPQANAPVTPPPPAETPKPPRAADASKINWGWPAQGQVVQPFTSSSKGIDIAGNPGDPVVAAASGKVMYSGNGVRGLGNLIIINHEGGFITAYAHNRALLVKTGQEVQKGAKIAEIGQSDAPTPRLHFEIRSKGTPVDPLQYLPSR